jgi:hypothetical protein
MSLGIAEIDEQTIPEQLGNMSFIALDDFSADLLIRTDNFSQVLRIELSRQGSGIDQVTEHDGELPAFCVRRCRRERCSLRRALLLGSRLWYCLSRWSGDCLGRCSFTRPHENPAIFIRGELLSLDNLRLEGFEILVV